MSDGNVVLTDRRGAVALITLNRPEKRNALDGQVRCAFLGALDAAGRDQAVRAVLVTGAGDKSFVAGAEISEFEGHSPVDQYRVMKAPSIYDALERSAKPVIAAINGYCLGGGMELALACDIRIASSSARFGQPEVNLGIIPGGGGTQRLPRVVGLGAALRLILTGDMIDAAEALRLRLVEEVVEPPRLIERSPRRSPPRARWPSRRRRRRHVPRSACRWQMGSSSRRRFSSSASPAKTELKGCGRSSRSERRDSRADNAVRSRTADRGLSAWLSRAAGYRRGKLTHLWRPGSPAREVRSATASPTCTSTCSRSISLSQA
jgi:enoyl-CoA hydratase/carnithine racemase